MYSTQKGNIRTIKKLEKGVGIDYCKETRVANTNPTRFFGLMCWFVFSAKVRFY